MIQDIGDKRLANEFHAKSPSSGSIIMMFSGEEILLKNKTPLEFPLYLDLRSQFEKMGRPFPACVFLFAIGEDDYFLACQSESGRAEWERAGYLFSRMFGIRSLIPKERVFAASTAWHLYCWYRDHQFCGRCGRELEHGVKQRVLHCSICGNMVFPKIAPAVIVGVTCGDKILMTKYAGREYKKYALIAGFTEIGETAEQTVEREVYEEVGLRVKNIRYYKSQPWGFDENLLLGFFCEADGQSEIHMDQEELAVAEWVPYDQIPDDENGLSLTAEMMTCFRDSRQNG